MANSNREAIVSTLAYFDIFDYPLTQNEIEKYIPFKLVHNEFEKSLKNKNIQQKASYFFLPGREQIVGLRKKKEIISKDKLQKAQSILFWFRYIPTILYVGISGSLAMQNAKLTDDIDVFIITKQQTLWITRLFVNGILLLSGKLRRFKKHKTRDTICTNMWLDEDHLVFDQKRQNLYTAHEIIQLLSIINKESTYEMFLFSNNWIQKFFPNIPIKKVKRSSSPSSFLFVPLELLAEKIQLFYMKKHRTTETITKGFVAFHPKDYTNGVLQKWKEQQKKWNIR